MKKPDKYAETLFVFVILVLCNVSVRIISDIYDESQVYYLGFTESTYVITVCFLPSAEYYYASRDIAPTITESMHPSPHTSRIRLDTVTLEHSVNTTILESHIHNAPEQLTATIDIVEVLK